MNEKVPQHKYHYCYVKDPFRSWIRGYDKREASTVDMTELHSEAELRNYLFPSYTVSVQGMPGRITYSREYFKIGTHNLIQRLISDYFIAEKYDGLIYDNAKNLGEFFEHIYWDILLYNRSVHVIEWEKVKLTKSSFWLPKHIRRLHPSIVQVREEEGEIWVSRSMSLISKLFSDNPNYCDADFSAEETLVFNNPTHGKAPMAISLKHLNKLVAGLSAMTATSKAAAYPSDHTLPVELARFRPPNDAMKTQNMARLKVRRIFRAPIYDIQGLITDFYGLYCYKEWKKQLNNTRATLVSDFNEQLLLRVQAKNNLKRPLTLEYEGFINNELLEARFKDYTDGNISISEFRKAIQDRTDTE